MSAPSPKEIWDYVRYITEWSRKTMWNRMVKLQDEARINPRLYMYLGWLYREYTFRYDQLIFPFALFTAPKNQRYDLESVLGNLDMEANDGIDHVFDQVGQAYLKKLVRDAPGKPPWDDATYRMTALQFGDQLKLECALGGYYNMLKSCEILEFELLTRFSQLKPPPSDFQWFTDQIWLRKYLHSRGSPIKHPLGRSVAISISTPIIFAEGDTFKVLIRERSRDVAIYKHLLHVLPSFMFQPQLRFYKEEYSVKHSIYREYLEEVIGREDLERPTGGEFFDFFYSDPNLSYLRDLEERGDAKFYFTGVAMNLLSLRPEICTLLLITDPEWIVNQRQGKEVRGHKLSILRTNWEFKLRDELKDAKFKGIAVIDLTKDLMIPDNLFKPENFVPPGAAALKLGIDVAHEELGL